MILAHRLVDIDGKVFEQPLDEHLYAVGEMAGRIGKDVSLEMFMKLAGYLHDIGKADRCFQNYICGVTKQQVNHSSAGGRVLEDFIHFDQELTGLQNSKLKFQYFQEILTYIILAHHGLYDQIPYDGMEHNSYRRIRYDEAGDYYYKEDVIPFIQELSIKLQEKGGISITELIKAAYNEFELCYTSLVYISRKNCDKEKQREEKEYYISCFTRLCLSILKEADIYDSANAFHNPKQRVWSKKEISEVWARTCKKIELMYQDYEGSLKLSEINKTRNKLADMVKNAAINCDDGIYKLELPTGAGKTKAGLRYALTNAKAYERNRVLYITSYLSVLEQNAADIRSMINEDDVILEHHSDVIEDQSTGLESSDDSKDYNDQNYLKESWESPIILTTMVQFFNTLFKEKASNIRRFCKLINSVIIIDEVQSLPIKVISNFNLMMNFMKTIMHCNIVQCTATQPILDSKAMKYPIYYGDEKNSKAVIIDTGLDMMKCFHRVDFYNLTGNDAGTILSSEQLSSLVERELDVFDSCLVVLNTKAAVANLYDYLDKNSFNTEVIYLTTNLCAAHRLDIISEMKRKLLINRQEQAHKKIVCISTQLIEAGVDVDFDVVLRSLAGIDSLVQCGGRCNREGKLVLNGSKHHGRLFIVKYCEENLSNLPDIKASADSSEYAIRNLKEAYREDNFIEIERLEKSYFNKYYVSNRNKMDYVDLKRKSNMIEELGRNDPDRNSYLINHPAGKQPVMYQAFKTAAENFELIDQGTTGVIVPYKNQELLEQLNQAMEKKDYDNVHRLLRQLQRYTVNMHLSPKTNRFILENKELNIHLLLKEYYNEKKGVSMDELANLII